MTKDMTEGNVLGLILRFALPLLVGNLLQQTYNMIDAAIVGRFLGTQALAGVGATSSVQFLVLGFYTGLCSGFGVPVARDFGANQFGRMRRHFSWCFADSGDCSHPDNRLCTSLSMDSQDAVCNGGYLRQRSYLHIDYFPWTAIYTFVQLPVKHSACGWGQQNAVFVSGLFSLFECGIGSDLYHRI